MRGMTGRMLDRLLGRRRLAAPLAVLAVAIASLGTPADGARPRRVDRWRAGAIGGEVVVRSVPVENAGALDRFHEALHGLAAGSERRVRVLHFGDSNVAADLWTGEVRRALQERFGDGGPGYLLPRPHGSWHSGSTSADCGRAFNTRRLGFAKGFGPPDGLWGLAGVAMEGAGPEAWFEIEVPEIRGGVFELHALGRPCGGAVDVSIDGMPPLRVDVRRDEIGLVRSRWRLDEGAHGIRGRVVGGRRVRILGFAVERDRSGVVYDTLGINGHRAAAINLWDEGLLAEQLVSRRPDLVVLSYGGNEALSPRLSLPKYERDLRRAVSKMRRLTFGASCLLVGPVSMCPERRKVARVVEVQRRVAHEMGCGFWDSRAVSGGPGSLCRWIASRRDLVSGDHLHLRKKGYVLVAREFTRALLAGY
ncbi:MAG: GDSL-type esterase/lipase family protein [Polyangia bacterium]